MDITSKVYISLEVIIGAVSVVGNTLVLLAIYKNYKLRTVTNTFIASLALADLLVGILVSPLAALSYLGLPQNYMWCVFTNSVVVVLTQISIFNLCAIAVERFIAIKSPYFYQQHLTLKVAVIISVIAWIGGMIVGFVPMFGWNLGPMVDNKCAFVSVIDMKYMVYFNFFGFVLSPLVIMFLIYLYIYVIVRQQLIKIAALERVSQTEQRKQSLNFSKEVKAAKSLAVVIGMFAVCWLPIHILNCITLLCKGDSCMYHINLLLAAILLSHINSAINPFLYAIGNSQFQVAFRKMFCGTQTTSSWKNTLTQEELETMAERAAKAKSNNTESLTPVNSESRPTIDRTNTMSSTQQKVNDSTDNGHANPVFFI